MGIPASRAGQHPRVSELWRHDLGRALDNVFVERLGRTGKYEYVYLHECALVPELEKGLGEYFTFYNQERLHQSLSYQTPAEVHFAGLSSPIAA